MEITSNKNEVMPSSSSFIDELQEISTYNAACSLVEKATDGVMNIESLPAEALQHIFLFLSQNDLGKVAQVCKSWKQISRFQALWKKVDVEIFGSGFQMEAASNFCDYLPSFPTHLKFIFRNECYDAKNALDLKTIFFTLQDKFCNLQILIIYHAEFVDSLKRMISLFAQVVPSLKEVIFRSCKFPEPFDLLGCQMSPVELLDICDCTTSDPFTISPTPYWIMPELKKLYLANLKKININYPLQDAPFIQNLEILNVHGTKFGNLTFRDVGKKASSLTELYICKNEVFSDEDFLFSDMFPCLKIICIAEMQSLTGDAITSLIQSCPTLEVIYCDERLAQSYAEHPSVVANLFRLDIVKVIENCHHYLDIDYMSHS